jgi:hypothetical protein
MWAIWSIARQDLAFRSSFGSRRTYRRLNSRLKRILAAYVPVRIVNGDEGSCYIGYDGKVN